jgi:lactate dehydrogenase-like 2-hydroxyacid dehydrogenase
VSEEVQVRIQVIVMDIRSALLMFAVVEELLVAIMRDISEGEIQGHEADSWTDLAGMYVQNQQAITSFQERAKSDPDSITEEDLEEVEGTVLEYGEVGRTIASTLENIGVKVS